MPKAWSRFLSRAGEIPHLVNNHYMDISLEQKDGLYTQLICAEVSRVTALSDGMITREIPAQRYLYYCHEGAVEEIADSFGKMYDWASQNGLTLESFKLDIGYTKDGSEQDHDLYVKIGD